MNEFYSTKSHINFAQRTNKFAVFKPFIDTLTVELVSTSKSLYHLTSLKNINANCTIVWITWGLFIFKSCIWIDNVSDFFRRRFYFFLFIAVVILLVRIHILLMMVLLLVMMSVLSVLLVVHAWIESVASEVHLNVRHIAAWDIVKHWRDITKNVWQVWETWYVLAALVSTDKSVPCSKVELESLLMLSVIRYSVSVIRRSCVWRLPLISSMPILWLRVIWFILFFIWFGLSVIIIIVVWAFILRLHLRSSCMLVTLVLIGIDVATSILLCNSIAILELIIDSIVTECRIFHVKEKVIVAIHC